MDQTNNRQDLVSADKHTDNEIIHRVLEGEKDLYAVIVRRYNQRLYRVALSVVEDETEAEDIMQAAYIKAYENLRKFEFRALFSTWLTRILINESLLRVRKKRRTQSVNSHLMNNESHKQAVLAETNPFTELQNGELGRILESAIRELPEKYRTVFILREIENMNIAETKECLAISEVNVKVRLNRAKLMLRRSLSRYYRKEDLFPFHLSRCNRMTERVMSRIRAL